MKYLIVVAHPDDEVLGCGGTIARLAREGHDVYIAILGEGLTSRYKKSEKSNNKKVAALEAHSRQVAEFLNCKDIFFHNLPDNCFDTLPLLKIVQLIEALIKQIQPQIIFTHHRGDLNIDHSILHRAVLTATRPVSGCTVQEIYAVEVASSTEWTFGQLQPLFRPNTFVDICATLETKVEAMEMYESESRPFPHPRSSDALRAAARRWGSMAGVEAAEAFELIRSIR
jgi:LmbE family N-acetylglucosaminyl deacetylase